MLHFHLLTIFIHKSLLEFMDDTLNFVEIFYYIGVSNVQTIDRPKL